MFPPRTEKVQPLNGQSDMAKYPTIGDMLAGSHGSGAAESAGALIRSLSHGVASVIRVRAVGTRQFECTPYRLSSLAQIRLSAATPAFAAP